MAKIRKIFHTDLPLNFNSKEENFHLYWSSFLSSELGRIYQVIPWKELAKGLNLTTNLKGRPPTFDPQGKIALQFLKHYTNMSDQRLMERINADYQFQFFCGVDIRVEQPLTNYKIISSIRTEIGEKLDILLLQKTLAKHWKPYIKDPKIIMEDATCYESWMRYPTNVKLLWEANEWIYNQIKQINKSIKGRMPRSRFSEQKSKYLAYSRTRKKTYKKTRRRTKSLIYLLGKQLGQLSDIEQKLPDNVSFPARYYDRLLAITKILEQQQELFEGKKVKDRIVSIDKSYIRPIVRGKETKRVEFGAKVNLLQTDGINFIEHISFDAFNEGTRLINSVWLTQTLFNIKVHMLGGDGIYATNANRKFCSQNGIVTSFVRKGRASKDEPVLKQIRKIISTERATRMEGAFGTQKNHYSLDKIKARTKQNEILWIFFGIHTANAVEISRRKFQQEHQELSQTG
jgi:hypothetical protein